MEEAFFNYIVTIHNKQDLIRDVIVSILMCCRKNSRIYAVLDGCTDETESILDQIAGQFDGIPLVKLYANDVHEILSINTGLAAAPQEGEGFNVILQDDVVLADFNLEEKIKGLYAWGQGKLGFVSLRLGANFRPDAARSGQAAPFTNCIENAYGHGLSDAEVLLPGRFGYRTVPIKSPICVPTRIIREIGPMNKDLAPYMHDDVELAVRVTNAGFQNGVFAIRFYSDLSWGGTRATPHPDLHRQQERNMNIIRETHGPELKRIVEGLQRTDVVEFPELCSAALDRHAMDHHQEAKERLARYSDVSLGTRIRSRLGRVFAGLPVSGRSSKS